MAKKTTKKKAKPIQAWAFIDTNIYLDFYRSNNEARTPLLEKIQKVSDRIISTYQVQMEFLKNRQNELLKSVQQIKNPNVQIPGVMGDGHISTTTNKIKKESKKRDKYLVSRVENMLTQPNSHDQVYQALDAVFTSPNDHVLKRDMDIRHKIKRLACKRFMLGYPPRKNNDTSVGDALNWEWIINCAERMQGRFYIVSRDGDFGCTYKNKQYLNDQLKLEFRERVGKKSIIYTHRPSDVLKALEIKVTEEELKAESEMIQNHKADEKAPNQSAYDNEFRAPRFTHA